MAIDAIRYSNPKTQFQRREIDREMKKCFAGFLPSRLSNGNHPVIATGNWGCGAFKGNKQLKCNI